MEITERISASAIRSYCCGANYKVERSVFLMQVKTVEDLSKIMLDISQEERRVTSRKVILFLTVSKLMPSELTKS